MELIVEGKGLFLGKHQGRLRVTQGEEDAHRGAVDSPGGGDH